MTHILGQSVRGDVGTHQIQIFEICKSIFFQTEVFESVLAAAFNFEMVNDTVNNGKI